MALPVRKGYSGAGVSTTLTSNPTISDTTFTVAAVTNWPSTYPFFIVVDPGTIKEEKMLVSAVSTLTLTVTRGQDNTDAVSHSSGAVCYPVFTAAEANEANYMASVMTTKGDLITTNGSDINRLGVGTNTYVLQADSTSSNGVKWGQVLEAGISDGSVSLDKLAINSVDSSKIVNGSIVKDDLAASLLKLVCPVGTISAYPHGTAPTGWLLCNGTSTSGYTELAALVGATTPDFRGKFPMGKTDSGVGSTLLGSGGNRKILETHLPSHQHGPGTLAAVGVAAHQHSAGTLSVPSGGSHAHSIPVQVVVRNVINVADTSTSMVEPSPSPSINDVTANASSHSHPSLSGSTADGGAHGHTISGVTNNTGGDTDYFQPFISVNFIIKHDY